MKGLPGYEFAIEHGYNLISYGASRQTAWYHNGKWGLDASYEGEAVVARLQFGQGLIIVGTAWFSLPGNFDIFERHISDVYNKLKAE